MAQKPVLVIGNLVLVRRRTLHHAGLDKKPPRCQAVVLRRHSELSLARHQPTLRSILRRPCDAEPHQGTFESTDLWICEQTDSPAHVHPIFSCPSSGRGGWDHINCMGSAAPWELCPEPVPLAACSLVPVPGELCLWAWFILCCATSPLSRGSCMPQRFPDYSNTGTVKERKDSKGKKYFSRLKNFIWCTV